MSAYEPGTVAIATVRGVKGVRVMLTPDAPCEVWVSEVRVDNQHRHNFSHVTDVRPLVVLDLNESKGKSLLPTWLRNNIYRVEEGSVTPSSIGQDMAWLADQIEAQTKPPRIPEPGLWGVVETTFKDGRSRHGWAVRRLTDGGADWQDGSGDYHSWDDLINPTLIREGVES